MVVVEYRLRRQTLENDTDWSDVYRCEYTPATQHKYLWPREIAKAIAKSHRIGKVALVAINTEERDTELGHLTRFCIWAETPKKRTDMDIIILE
jgi:hypothetical protein